MVFHSIASTSEANPGGIEMNRFAIGTCTTLAAAALAFGGGTASAKGGDRFVRVAGTCSSGISAKLKAKNDGRVIEVEFEVDQNRTGVRWNWRLVRGTAVVRRGASITRGPSGSFSVERRIANPAGVNRVAFRAVSSGGKTCRATLRV